MVDKERKSVKKNEKRLGKRRKTTVEPKEVGKVDRKPDNEAVTKEQSFPKEKCKTVKQQRQERN